VQLLTNVSSLRWTRPTLCSCLDHPGCHRHAAPAPCAGSDSCSGWSALALERSSLITEETAGAGHAVAYLVGVVHPHPTAGGCCPAAAAGLTSCPQPPDSTPAFHRGKVSEGQPPTHVCVAGEDGGPPVALRRQLRPLVLQQTAAAIRCADQSAASTAGRQRHQICCWTHQQGRVRALFAR
jgi:hypothetical protein